MNDPGCRGRGPDVTGRGVSIHLTDPADADVVTPEVLALVLGGLDRAQGAARVPAPRSGDPADARNDLPKPAALVWDRGVLTVPPPPMPTHQQTP